ncbi:MAG: hypothetical protein WCG80_16330 [Spirochaetales bacterium]
MTLFDRSEMQFFPLASRKNKVEIVSSSRAVLEDRSALPAELDARTYQIAQQILKARETSASVILAFGAHTIKNSLGVLLIEFIKRGWLTHLATNGAGVIHDWEFAFQGLSSEDVRENVDQGRFGTWHETCLTLNLALAVGAFEGRGYGESVGSMILQNGLELPSRENLTSLISAPLLSLDAETLATRAAAADLLSLLVDLDLPSGWYPVAHRFAEYSVQKAALTARVPFTSHPMFGCDIIYTHPANHGAALGRTAERDFLSFAHSVANLEGGVYLSVGSAVMSPMIFEKSLSMARNVAQQRGKDIRDCHIHVVDLAEAAWDWSQGEPPLDNPAYYHRFMKTFHRMGCDLDYTATDNRLFFLALYRNLLKLDATSERN